MFTFEKVEQEAKAMTATGATMQVKLDEDSDYQMLLLRFAFTADASQVDATKERIMDWITNITVIGDDDKYIVNANARQLAALHFYRHRKTLTELVDCTDNAVNILELPIYFGRHMADKEYFLKGDQFNKLTLNVTNTDSATGNFFDACTLEVRSYQWKDHSLVPVGVIRTKEIVSWTPANATDSMVEEIPDKHQIEKIMVAVIPTYVARNAALTSEYSAVVDKLKLTFKGGDIVVFNDDIEELAWRNAHVYGMAETHGVLDGQNGDYWDSGLGYVQAAFVSHAETPIATFVAGLTKGTVQRLPLVIEGAGATDYEYYIHAVGYAYLDTVIFDFAPKGDMTDIYNPNVYKKAQLKITAGSVSGSVQIVVCEIVKAF